MALMVPYLLPTFHNYQLLPLPWTVSLVSSVGTCSNTCFPIFWWSGSSLGQSISLAALVLRWPCYGTTEFIPTHLVFIGSEFLQPTWILQLTRCQVMNGKCKSVNLEGVGELYSNQWITTSQGRNPIVPIYFDKCINFVLSKTLLR